MAYACDDVLVEARDLAGKLPDGVRVVAFTPRSEYDNGHIAGSAQVDWPELEISDTSEVSVQQW